MGEQPEWVRHRVEAERFRRLADVSPDPKIRLGLAEKAQLHGRIADRLRALNGGTAHQRADQQRADPGKQPRNTYRLQLLMHDASDLPLSIETGTDGDALRIAWLVQDACTEFCGDFELWQESRCIANSRDQRTGKRPHNLDQITSSIQVGALRTEEALVDSRLAIARSRKLLSAIAELRTANVRSFRASPQS